MGRLGINPGLPSARGLSTLCPVNLPNAITMSRLLLTALFIAGAAWGGATGHWVALVSFVVAAVSDFLDGWLARRMGLVTPMGKLLDPLADKVLVCSAYVYLSAEGLCPVWITVMILAREFLVTGLRQIAMEAGQVIAADGLGKWKTGMQLCFCITCLCGDAFGPLESGNVFVRLIRYLSDPQGWLTPWSMWTALSLTVLSGLAYLKASWALLRMK